MAGRSFDGAVFDLSEERELPGGGTARVLVLGNAAILAGEFDMPLREAEARALEHDITPERYLRNYDAFSYSEQARLLRSHVAMVGLGGLGGHLLEQLVRSGVGSVRVCDGDVFEASNLNRQLLCTHDTVGHSKAEAARDRTARLNPASQVEAVCAVLGAEAMREFVRGADLVLDALGGLEHREALQRAAADEGVPLVTAAMAGFGGYVATVLPGSSGPANFLGQGAGSEETGGTPAPAVNYAASVQGAEALRILAGREPNLAGGMHLFDLDQNTFDNVRFE